MYKFPVVIFFLICLFGCKDQILDERYELILSLEQNLSERADSILTKSPCLSEIARRLNIDRYMGPENKFACTSNVDSILLGEFDSIYKMTTSDGDLPMVSSWTSDFNEYLYIRKLSVLALRYLHQAKFEKSLVTAYYALHLIEVSKHQKEWPLLYADLLYITIQNDIQNYHKRHTERLKRRTRKAATLYINLKATNQLVSLISDLKQLPVEIPYVDSLQQHIVKFEKWSPTYLLKKGIESEIEGKFQEARATYEQIIAMTSGSECNVVRGKASIYIADTYLAQNQLNMVEDLLPLTEESLSCSQAYSNDMNFYAQSTLYNYHLAKKNYDAALAALHHRRALAPLVHAGHEDHHLVDVYVANATNFLRTYKLILESQRGLSEKQWAHISSLFIESKNRNLYKLIHSKSSRSLDKMRSQKDSLSQFCSKIPDEFSNVAYWHLYELYSFTVDDVPAYDDLFSSSIEPQQSADFIDFIGYEDELFYFANIAGERTLQLYDIRIVQSIVKQLLKKIIDKGQTDSLVLKLDTFIFKSKPIVSDQLFISGDNCLLDIPLHILPSLSASNCVNLHNRMDMNQTKADTLSLDDMFLCSYSDASTLSDPTPSILPELSSGYQETKGLSKNIAPKAAIFMGSRFDKQSAVSSMNSSILHLSTHSVVDSTDIYGAAFYVRTGMLPEKFYGYQLPTDLPKFVYLNACKTSSGYYLSGEGQYSLARYFKIGGSEAILKTLWNVNDEAGKDFALLFYKLWSEGGSCHEAFTATQDSMKMKYHHPFFYAPFILEGNPNLYLK